MSVNILFPTCQLLEALYIYCICKHTAHTTVHAVDMCNSYMPRSIYFQIARVGNSLFRSFALRSFAHSLCALSLFALSHKIVHFKERSWVIHSWRSLKKSDCEQITLVALLKRAKVSKSLSSLFTKEQQWANRSCCSLKRATWVIRSFALKKRAICSKNSYFLMFLTVFHCFSPFYAQEWIDPIALHSGALSLTKNKQFSRKTKEQIPNPANYK